MKVFNICKNEWLELPNGKKHEWVAKYPLFDKQKAHEWLEFLQPHYKNELWLEESEESLRKFADNMYIPEQIKFGEQRCDVEFKDSRVRILIVGKWVDISHAIRIDMIGLERFNEFNQLRNECWNGRNKYIVNECVLDEVHMHNDGTFTLMYGFTGNSYLNRRQVVGGNWRLKNHSEEGCSATPTESSYNALIRVNVYW